MTNIPKKEVKSNRAWREECEALRQRVRELEAALSDAKDSVVSWVADNEKMISSMEDELAAANRGAERNAHINRELARELAALKAAGGAGSLDARIPGEG